MRHRLFNEDGEKELVFVMGWGNRWTHENVSWLIGQLADAGYRVHAFELPTDVDDFKADWLEPIAEYVVDLDGYQLLAHSLGALVGQALDGAENHIYLSPCWGYGVAYPRRQMALLGRIPTAFPFVPAGEPTRDVIGELATDHELATTPRWVSPAFLRETLEAQEDLLLIDHDAVVFCSLRDPLIDLHAIGQRVPPEHVVLYDGGHELFASAVREEYVDAILASLEDGAAAVEDRPTVTV